MHIVITKYFLQVSSYGYSIKYKVILLCEDFVVILYSMSYLMFDYINL